MPRMKHALAAPDLWSSARTMLQRLLFLVGPITALALARLTARERTEVFAWLHPLEAMVRKLLLIEAAALAPPASRTLTAAAKQKSAANAAARTPSFALLPAAARDAPCPARIRQLGSPLLLRDLWRERERAARIDRLRLAPRTAPNARLTNRLRALQRAIEKPLAHARRLARFLARIAAAGQAAHAIAFAPLRRRPMMFHDRDFRRATELAGAVPYCSSG